MKQAGNKLLAFVMRIGDLFFLNILFLVCSIPVITIGASSTALFHCTIRMAQKKDSYLSRDFFAAFRKNLLKSTLLFLIVVIIYAILFCDFWLSSMFPGLIQTLFLAVFIALTICFSMIVGYLFPLLDYYGKGVFPTLRDAFFVSFGHVMRTCIMLFMNALIPVLIFLYPNFILRLFPLIISLAFSSIAYANSRIFLSSVDSESLIDKKNQGN